MDSVSLRALGYLSYVLVRFRWYDWAFDQSRDSSESTVAGRKGVGRTAGVRIPDAAEPIRAHVGAPPLSGTTQNDTYTKRFCAKYAPEI